MPKGTREIDTVEQISGFLWSQVPDSRPSMSDATSWGKDVLLLIERGDRHEIRNTGTIPLTTLNFYAPPAYTKAGNTLPAGRRS